MSGNGKRNKNDHMKETKFSATEIESFVWRSQDLKAGKRRQIGGCRLKCQLRRKSWNEIINRSVEGVSGSYEGKVCLRQKEVNEMKIVENGVQFQHSR